MSHDYELRDITNSEAMVNSYEAPGANTVAERNLVVQSSLRSKFPPMLIIKSANLRILDPIGQGNVILLSHFKLFFSCTQSMRRLIKLIAAYSCVMKINY